MRYIIVVLVFLMIPVGAIAYDSTYTGAQVDASVAAHIGRNTTVADPGSDAELVTEQAVREALDLFLPVDGSVPLTDELTLDENGVEFQETDTISDCSGFAATGGGIFYDDSEGIFKKCQDNVLSDLDTGGTGSVDTTGTVNANEIAVFNDSDTLKALTEGEFKAAYNLEPATDFYSVSGADAAFEAIDSNDFDPDRLAGDTTDDDVIDASLIGINEGTAEASIAADDLVLIYDTSEGAVNKMTRGNFVSGIGAGQAVIFDIGDDGGNDSTDVGEIATSGDTNSIFTEPSADKILIDLSNNWPGADLATTATTANAGDSATAFFSSGTIEHEYGGLEADVSAYSGLVKITGGATSAVTVTAFAESILDDANEATFKSTTNLEAGTDYYSVSGADTAFEAVDAEIARFDTADTVGADWEWQDGIAQSFGNGNDWEVSYDEAGDDRLEYVHTAGAGADVYYDLNDNAADSTYTITNSDGTYEANLVVEGDITSGGTFTADSIASSAVNNPYVHLNENDGTDYWIGIYDTTTDRVEFRRNATVNTDVDAYLDSDGMYVGGNLNIAAAHAYQIDGTQIDIADLGAGGNWTPTGTLNLDSSTLQNIGHGTVDDGSNYTTVSNSADDDTVDELMAAIDSWASGVSAGTLITLSDVTGADYTSGTIIIGDGSDSYDMKAVGGDITLAADGTVALAADVVAAAEMANADHGDVSWSGGVATVEAISGANAVDSDAYVDGSIDAAHLAADVIDETKIADDGLDSEHYNDASIDLAHLSTDSVDYTKTTGSIKSLTPVTDDADNFAANFTGANLYGGTFVANATGTAQLPAITAGMHFTIITLGDIAVVVEPNASDSFLMDGVQLDDADSATNTSSAGDIAVFQYYSAAGWIATTNGWTDED